MFIKFDKGIKDTRLSYYDALGILDQIIINISDISNIIIYKKRHKECLPTNNQYCEISLKNKTKFIIEYDFNRIVSTLDSIKQR